MHDEKSGVSNCPAFRAFIHLCPVALFSFFNLFRSTCSHPSSSCPSYSVIPSLPINLLLLIPRGQTIYTVSSLFSFSSPRPSLSLPPYFNFFPFFVFPPPFFPFFFSFFFLFDRGIKIHDSRDSFNIFNNFVLCLNYYYGSYLTVFANFESRILKS